MLLRDFIKKSQIETDENEILLLEDFFGINVSTSHPLELISDIETFLMTAWTRWSIMSTQKHENINKLTSKKQQAMLNRLSKKDLDAVQKLLIFGEELEKQLKDLRDTKPWQKFNVY